jgi:fibronectin-binding autotransporter adhesin
MRVRQVAGLLFLLCGFHCVQTYGQVVATWTNSTGNYSNATNWSTLTVPNNGGGITYDVLINGTGADTITYDSSGTVINSLTLGTGETFQDNSASPTLTAGSITNSGTINWGTGSNLTVNATMANYSTGTVNLTGLSTVTSTGLGNAGTMTIGNSNLTVRGDYTTDLGSFSNGASLLQLQNGSIGTISGNANSFGTIAVNASILTIQGNSNATNGGTLQFLNGSVGTILGSAGGRIGTVVVDNSTLTVGGDYGETYTTITNGGVLNIRGDAEISISDLAQFNLSKGSSATIGGSFTLEFLSGVTVDNSRLVVGGDFLLQQKSDGVTIQNGSTLSVQGTLLNQSVLTGLKIDATSSATVAGDFQNTFFAQLQLDGTLNVLGGFQNSGGSVMVTPGGTLTAGSYSQDLGINGQGFTDIFGRLIVNSFSQSGGATTIESRGLLSANTFSATGGTITVNGTLDPTAVEIGPGATLQGTGTIIGNVAMGGTILPGAPGTPGMLTLIGNYEQFGNGTFDELIGANSASFFNVSGDVALDLDSLLNITLLDGYNPLGQTFAIMDYNSLVGAFANGSYFCQDGYCWDVTYGRHEVDLTAVSTPEPSSLLLLFVGLAALAFTVHRKMDRAKFVA